MAGLRDTAAAVTYIHAVPATTMAVAMVTDDDLLLRRVRLALDREGLIAHVELAGRREPDLEGLDRRPDVVVLTGASCRELANVAHGVRRRLRDVHVVLLLGAHRDCGMRHSVEMPALSHRERQILRLVAAGLTNEEIARRLYLAKSTVAGHLTAVFRRLGGRSRSEAVTMILTGGQS